MKFDESPFNGYMRTDDRRKDWAILMVALQDCVRA